MLSPVDRLDSPGFFSEKRIFSNLFQFKAKGCNG